MSEENTVQPVSIGSAQLQTKLVNGQELTFSVYLFLGETVEEMNKRLDDLNAVALRQRKISEIPTLEAKLKQAEDQMHQHHSIIESLEQKKASKLKLKAEEETHLRNAPINIKYLQERIEQGNQEIEKLKADVK